MLHRAGRTDAITDLAAAAGFLAALVGSAMNVPPRALQAGARGIAAVAFARQVAIYLSHTRLGLDYTTAGCAFGRDRTTAAHAVRTVECRREDPALDAIVDYLERAVDAGWPGVFQREARP